jgi:putative membrane protein
MDIVGTCRGARPAIAAGERFRRHTLQECVGPARNRILVRWAPERHIILLMSPQPRLEPAELRDQLAVERTRLANERTLLAYVRTALGLVAAGVVLLQLIPGVLAGGGGLTLVATGLVVVVIGLVRFRKVQRRLGSGGAT